MWQKLQKTPCNSFTKLIDVTEESVENNTENTRACFRTGVLWLCDLCQAFRISFWKGSWSMFEIYPFSSECIGESPDDYSQLVYQPDKPHRFS